MGVLLGDPAKCRAKYTKGDIVISFQYVNGEESMVLFPMRKKEGGGAYVVGLSSAWKYTDMQYLVQQAAIAAEIMKMGTEKFTVHRVCDAIIDGLEELVRMKPEPESEKKVVGEGKLVSGDGQIIEFDVTH